MVDEQRIASSAKTVELSIIIVSYECREHVIRCLSSIQQSAGAEFACQQILVDNASRDGTVAAVRTRFPTVEVIEAGENLGFSASNNRGLERAVGRHVLLLNPDTVVTDGALEASVAALDKHPEVGMLGVKLVQADGSLDHACKRGFPTPLSALAYFSGFSRLRPGSARLARYTFGHVGPDQTSYVDAVNGAFMLVRRDALEDTGLLDEDYWLYMEDLDWCFRFWQHGWKVLYWPRVTVVHVKGGSSGRTRSWKANRAFHRGMWLFYRKHYAANRSVVTTVAVGVGIGLKCLASAATSATRRRLHGRG